MQRSGGVPAWLVLQRSSWYVKEYGVFKLPLKLVFFKKYKVCVSPLQRHRDSEALVGI